MLGLNSVSLPFILENQPKAAGPELARNVARYVKFDPPAIILQPRLADFLERETRLVSTANIFPFNGLRGASPVPADCRPALVRRGSIASPSGTAPRTRAFPLSHSTFPTHCATNARRACRSPTGLIKVQAPPTPRTQRILKVIRHRFGRRPIGREVPVPKTARQCDAIRDQLIAAVRAKAGATLHLMSMPWNLSVTGWYEVHRAGHNLWPVEGDFASNSPPTRCSPSTRKQTGSSAGILATLEMQGEDTALLLFALHGMGPNRAQNHLLTEILSRPNARYPRPGSQWVEEARGAQRDSLSPARSAARPAISCGQHTRRARSGLGCEPRVCQRRGGAKLHLSRCQAAEKAWCG